MNARKLVAYWELWQSEIRNWISTAKKQQKYKVALELKHKEPVMEETRKQELRKAQKEYSQAVKDAPLIRSVFLEQRAETEAKCGNVAVEKILK